MNILLIEALFDKFTLTKHNIICYIVFEEQYYHNDSIVEDSRFIINFRR